VRRSCIRIRRALCARYTIGSLCSILHVRILRGARSAGVPTATKLSDQTGGLSPDYDADVVGGSHWLLVADQIPFTLRSRA